VCGAEGAGAVARGRAGAGDGGAEGARVQPVTARWWRAGGTVRACSEGGAVAMATAARTTARWRASGRRRKDGELERRCGGKKDI
jgi:hypothetical protein